MKGKGRDLNSGLINANPHVFHARDLQLLSIINILVFVDNMVTVAMTQFCYCISKTALANVRMNGCVSIKLYLQK